MGKPTVFKNLHDLGHPQCWDPRTLHALQANIWSSEGSADPSWEATEVTFHRLLIASWKMRPKNRNLTFTNFIGSTVDNPKL